ncbi:MFS transporter [Arcanobacterium bovis]|uniref:MFS transporter n=1 Tax=Arcanobacterium bovis TaxID=2529275 RepID=A0A4Q9UZG1_9ACTO|nr:MFS transporter [Arcanobacterium bovis]TBW21394.1 MFS transporter [Arcanobacterium bovis]
MNEKVTLPREIWVLVIAAVCIALGFGIVAPVLPQFAKSFNVTNMMATFVVSAFALMRLTFAPASGWLSGVFGERRMYLIGIYIVALSSFTSAFAHSYWQLLLFRAMGGIGSVTFSVAAMSLVFRLAPPQARGRASAAYGSGFLLGNIIGPVIGAMLSALGYRGPFIIYAIMLVIAALIVTIAIPAGATDPRASVVKSEDSDAAPLPADAESGLPDALAADANSGSLAETLAPSAESDSRRADSQRTGRGSARKGRRRSRRRAARDVMTVAEALLVPQFRVALLTAFAQGWTNLGVRMSVVPLLAASLVGAPIWLPGALLGGFAVGNGLALLRTGRWSDIYGRRPIVITGLAVSGLFTYGMGVFSNPVLLLVMSVVAGIGSGFVQPAQQGAVADIIGNRSGGRVVSFFQQSADLGQIIGPIISGVIIDFWGFGAAYSVAGTILLAAALIWLFLVKEIKPQVK